MSEELTRDLAVHVTQEIRIAASPEKAFDALLGQLGPDMADPKGNSFCMKLEAWPGGRWFRDLGDNQGHLWGHVQVIKPPTLLELTGPMFMSYAAISHIQFRIAPEGDGVVLALCHQAIGNLEAEHCEGVKHGWNNMLEGVKENAER